jgi:hypothetical protein
MANPTPAHKHLQPHALLGRLLAHGAGADARVFRGYVGPSPANGRVSLYPSLGDLTFSIEIAEKDILESVDAPETLLPHGGTLIWVKRDAEVVFHGQQVRTVAVRSLGHSEARPVARVVSPVGPAAVRTAAARLVEVQRGRLQIQVRPGIADTCASCSCASCGPCKLCSSTCNTEIAVGPVAGSR